MSTPRFIQAPRRADAILDTQKCEAEPSAARHYGAEGECIAESIGSTYMPILLAALNQTSVDADLLAALTQIATDPPVSESPTIESILNRAQQIARAAIAKAKGGAA